MQRIDRESVDPAPTRRRRLTTLHELLQHSSSESDNETDSEADSDPSMDYADYGDPPGAIQSSWHDSESEPYEDLSSNSDSVIYSNDDSSGENEEGSESLNDSEGSLPSNPVSEGSSPSSSQAISIHSSPVAPVRLAANQLTPNRIPTSSGTESNEYTTHRNPVIITHNHRTQRVFTIDQFFGNGNASGPASSQSVAIHSQDHPEPSGATTRGISLSTSASNTLATSMNSVPMETGTTSIISTAAFTIATDPTASEPVTLEPIASTSMISVATDPMSTVSLSPVATTSTSATNVQNSSFEEFRTKLRGTPGKKSKMVTGDEANKNESTDEEAECCPICFEPWTSSGLHRLTSLKCGHLFGQSCIEKWLKGSGTLSCPQCKTRAHRKDIRVLFAKSVRCLDVTERDRAIQELDREKEARRKAEVEAAQTRLYHDLAMAECHRLRAQVERQRQLLASQHSECRCGVGAEPASECSSSSSRAEAQKFHLHSNVKICGTGGCRVLAYCQRTATLCVSQPSINALFPGFGVKKMNVLDLKMSEYVAIHSKAVRDVTFGTDGTLLSCSVDRSIKLTSLHSNTAMLTYSCPVPIWSCTWNSDDRNYIYAGLQNGTVCVFDTRQLTEPVQELNLEGSRSPVVSLQYVPHSMNAGIRCAGLLVTQMERSIFFEKKSDTNYTGHALNLGGNITSLFLEEATNHVLATYRPTARQPYVRHQVCQLTMLSEPAPDSSLRIRPMCNELHTFQAGSTQRLLTRSKLLLLPQGQGQANQLMACAGDESSLALHIWNVGRGDLHQKLTSADPVIDVCPVPVNDQTMLAALTEKQLSLYQWR